MRILIIGGVAGGATAAARIRRLDESVSITIIEKGAHISFANCGLPYYLGGEIPSEENLLLQTPEGFYSRYRVNVRLPEEATAIDLAAHRVTVRTADGRTYEEPYDKLLLAPGAEPAIPPLQNMDDPRVFTLRYVNDAAAIKNFIREHNVRSAVVAGGGPIGLETAENLKRSGLDVSVVELSDQILPPFDYDIACHAAEYLKKTGLKLYLQNALASVGAGEGGGLLLTLKDGHTIETGILVMCTGVRPDTKLARAAGLRTDGRGCVIVDAHMRTSDPDVYAVGDAVLTRHSVSGALSQHALAGPANKEARVAADNICGLASEYKGPQGSAILRLFHRTAAMTGISEKTAQALGLDYEKSYTHSLSHAEYFPGAADTLLKLIFERGTGRLLGAQVFGSDGVDKRTDVLAMAIRAGLRAQDLTEVDLCYAPPFGSAKDPVNIAGYVAENLLAGRLKQFHWHDVAALPRDGSVTLLDTRTEWEYARGHIAGFQNIPLDDLRERRRELPQGRPVYLTCQIGLRGYLSARILMQNGFEVYNLAGGYRLYSVIFPE
ncbi:MAG: FAD-dependent oxidoreductase [Gracilibacteraceae bacterium]|jgi:NADPH-dependent 2,4-dienoyl-CoA reductase/sulfur reductase-like enzyme/rhodanese-related sulfurtransferase|nr:FAD-dependent oxidoreductase [Gracilibacteraceae bacterium]